MKQNKIQIIGSMAIILILVIMMCNIVFSVVYSKILKKINISNKYIDEILGIDEKTYKKVDFSEIYPLKNEKEENKKNIIEKYEQITGKIKKFIEESASEKMIGYEKLIEYSYIYNDLISYNVVSNSDDDARIELEEGYYTRILKEKNTDECAKRLIEFNTYLNRLNINLLYVQAPYKISRTQAIPSIYKDYSNENMDNLLHNISGKVDYIDLRENIQNNFQNNLKLFYKTDHHWLPETGLWATEEISTYLNSNYNMNLKIENINPNRYIVKKYPNMYLGSDGRYVSLKKAMPDDFNLIIPNFETRMHVKITDRSIDKIGSFEDTLIDWSKVKYKNYYKISQYTAYAYGDRPLIEVHNELVNNNKKILFIRDSFSEVVVPYMSLENEFFTAIDLRSFNGSIKTYIEEFKPDMVIIMYNGDMITDLEECLKQKNNEDLLNMWDFE